MTPDELQAMRALIDEAREYDPSALSKKANLADYDRTLLWSRSNTKVRALADALAKALDENERMRPVVEAALKHGNLFGDCEVLDEVVDRYKAAVKS
jgi:hypothetical protein